MIDWKDGRVVDYSGLENRRAARHRGFESLSFRKKGTHKRVPFCIGEDSHPRGSFIFVKASLRAERESLSFRMK